jgi:phosphoribosyl-AMP cyclohydrolase
MDFKDLKFEDGLVKKLWKKGGSSGHEQIVHDILIDCDAVVLTLKVAPTCVCRTIGLL